MLYRDIDRKLDMQFGISIEFKHKLVSLLLKEMETIPAYLHHSERASYMDLFVHAKEVNRILGAIAPFRPTRHGNFLIIRLQGPELLGITEPSRWLLEVASSLPGDAYVHGNRFYSLVRFHHNDLEKVSKIISDSLSVHRKARLEILGRSPGGVKILESINERIKLSAVAFEFDMTPYITEVLKQPHIEEVNIQLVTTDKYRVVLYPEDSFSLGEKTVTVSKESGVYATVGTIKPIKELYVACDEMQIPLAASIARCDGKKMRLTEFIPEAFKDRFIETLFEITAKYPELNLTLSQMSDLDDDLWDWL